MNTQHVLTGIPTDWTVAEWEVLIAGLTRRRLIGNATAAMMLAGIPGSLAAQSSPAADGPWNFTDDRGITVSLPAMPRRIVAFVDCAAALWAFGIRPVGYFGPATSADGTSDPRIGDADLTSIPSVGEQEIDVEQLIALQPDLIISNRWSDQPGLNVIGDLEATIAEIAPVVGISMHRRSVADLIDRYGEYAAALGIEVTETPEIVAARQAFDDACVKLQTAIAGNPGIKTLFVYRDTGDQLFIADPEYWPQNNLFRDLGLTIVEVPGAVGDPVIAVSWEEVGLIQADLILLQDQTLLTSDQAVWNGLAAVKAGQVSYQGSEWYCFTYPTYTRLITEFAATIARAKVVTAD